MLSDDQVNVVMFTVTFVGLVVGGTVSLLGFMAFAAWMRYLERLAPRCLDRRGATTPTTDGSDGGSEG